MTATLSVRNLITLGMAPFFVYLLNYVLLNFTQAMYWPIPVDTPMHALGGLAIAYSAAHATRLLEKNNKLVIKSMLVKIFIILATVVFAAVVWEFYEFLHDYFFGTSYQTTNADTMKDLFMGLLGGLVFCVAAVRRK
ncbi:MAG: hypothetical protein AAB579_04085 [Patescibacteria group bacterium]